MLSINNVIDWAKPNETFRHYVRKGEKLDADSHASWLMKSGEEREAAGMVSAAAWIEDSRLDARMRIHEDSIFQPHYNSVLTILTINEPLEVKDPYDEDSLSEELDPTEFSISRRRWPGRR